MIKHPEYFVAIVEAGSLTKAAQKLYVSQPYLSQYVRQLESSLGTELFDHGSSPLRLTHAGRLYYKYVLQFISLSENIRKEFQDIKSQVSGHIRLGIPDWRAWCTLPVIYPDFYRQYPQIKIELTEARPHELTEALLCGNLDIIIMNLGNLAPELLQEQVDYEALFAEELLFAVPTNHDAVQEFLRNRDTRISPLTLMNQIPLIATKSERTFPSNREHLFREYYLEPEIIIEIRNFSTAINLVATGIACAFVMSGNAMIPGLSNNITYFPVNSPENAGTVAVFYRKNGHRSNMEKLFIQSAKESLARYKIQY